MSLTTRCPACETAFKVIPDQLKVSSGWVRCGRCAEVFDAATHMLASSGAGVQTPTSPKAFAPPAQPAQATPPTQTPPKVADAATSLAPAAVAKPALEIAAKAASAAASSPLVAPIMNTVRKQPGVDLLQVPELSFVRNAKSKAFWQTPQVVRGLIVSLLVLTGLLAFQMVLDQRNLIAAKYPGLQAGLEHLCSPLGCSIEAVKQLDALKIDSSTFQKIQESTLGETFALKVTLKNNAAWSLAVPALELTLTDASDKPVMRRVLLPSELGFKDKTLAAASEWNASQSVFVSANTGQNRTLASVTGYRVLAFYP